MGGLTIAFQGEVCYNLGVVVSVNLSFFVPLHK